MKRLLVGAFTALAMMGCGQSFALNMTQFSAGLATLNEQYDKTAAMIASHADEFNESELTQLNVTAQHIQGLREAAYVFVADSGGVTQALIHVDQVRMLYESARSAYGSARYVICPEVMPDVPLIANDCARLKAMPEHEQHAVEAFDQQARQTRQALEGLLNSPSGTDITQAVSDVLTIGATAARVARLGML